MNAKEKRLKNKIKIFIKLFLMISCASFLAFLWNFDRISSLLPSRYAFFFTKVNDLLFGKVQIVEIRGNKMLTRDEILESVYKESVLADDTSILNGQNQIETNLNKSPVVEFVSIKRFLPNKMVIYIKEKDLILRLWNYELKKFFSISRTGEIIEFNNPRSKLPLVIGEVNIKDVLKLYSVLENASLIECVTDIIPFFNYRFDIVLNRETLVLLPEDDICDAISILSELITKNNILNKNIKQIDLRIKGKIVVQYFAKDEPKKYKPISSYTILSW